MSTLERTGTGGPKLLNPATAETNAAFQGFGGTGEGTQLLITPLGRRVSQPLR
jgi:hypothetical protein